MKKTADQQKPERAVTSRETWTTPRLEELDVNRDTANAAGAGGDFNGRLS